MLRSRRWLTLTVGACHRGQHVETNYFASHCSLYSKARAAHRPGPVVGGSVSDVRSRVQFSRYTRPLEHSKTHPVHHLVCAVRPASGGQQARRHTAVRTSSAALSGHRRPPRWHHGRRRELLRAAMLPPRAAAWQPSKVCSKATSGRLLPSTECSLRSGCAVDERHGAGTHTSTLRGRGRASTLTWVSLSVGKHSATAPAIVRARSW